MNLSRPAFPFVSCLTLLLVSWCAAAVRADEPATVQVAVHVVNLGKFDVSTGTFTVDFYLNMKGPAGFPSDFEFANGRAAAIDKIIDTPTEKFFRIQANLASSPDLRRFPFDRQSMRIVLEDKLATRDKLRYEPATGESGVDESVGFTGWNLDGWETQVIEHAYPAWGETYSRYVFSVHISRIAFNSVLKTFLPVFFIVLVVLSSFVMGPDKAQARLAMAGSGLVASVMFHVSISNQLPPVGYLTFADRFMVLTYLVTLATFVINVLIVTQQERKRDAVVQRIHRATEYSMFALVPAAYAVLFAVELL